MPRELYLSLTAILMATSSTFALFADEPATPSSAQSPPERSPVSCPIVEQAIRNSLQSPTGKLTQADLNGVTRLVLANTKVTDQGLIQVASLPNLTSLALALCPEISDAGLKPLLQCKKLTTLSLVSTNITDAGLKDLAKMPTLQTLGLSNTSVTEDGIAELKKRLPKCTIHAGNLKPKFVPSPIKTNPLLGSWEVVEGEINGQKKPGGIGWKFTPDGSVTIFIPAGRLIDINNYEVDQTNQMLDMFKGKKSEGVVMPCIYKLENDTLRVSGHPRFGQQRPNKIGSDVGDPHISYTFKRIAPKIQ